jgi:two-component system response regulator NreC
MEMDPPDLHLAPGSGESEAAPSHPAPALPIRVVLADDHAFMRRSLRLVLDGEQGLEVVAEAEDLASVVRHLHEHEPHVLVLDLNLPGEYGIATIGQLRKRMPQTQLVVLTMHAHSGFAQRAQAAGALGFVLKDSADTTLGEAVRAAARGESYGQPASD